jgi:hypothetical protein
MLAESKLPRGTMDISALSRAGSYEMYKAGTLLEIDFGKMPNAKGVPEDHVTGSAHTQVVPFWAQRLGRNKLEARQLSSRGGRLTCELRGDRVTLSAPARLYMSGEIDISITP